MSIKEKAIIVSNEKIRMLDSHFSTIDSDMAIAMSFVRRAQGMTFDELESKVSGLNQGTLRRYMQQSYRSIRPIHFVAAMSWVMMVPMMSYYYALNIKNHNWGLDESAIKALYRVGRLPAEQFDICLQLITSLMDPVAQDAFYAFRAKLLSSVKHLSNPDDLLPPKVLDINEFAIDYYRSVAVTVKRFREEKNISINLIARVLGLTEKQYLLLEDDKQARDFSVSIGYRIKFGFELASHADFTSEMRQFPQFYQLRQRQHIRDSLTLESFRLLSNERKLCASEIITSLSDIYIKSKT
ncbi:hypothetical protein BS333_04745 [Vibrio azureus]|uniref:Uncharacterized protein n=1 Tax=Vibrio azureus NBRC 104587 TaxID=1219077 RepID=U3A4D5_9VIBR|nr:hypothetical protein [Vibrio azureus]AUI85732.1 hypothetical protein BS333_04745 [Vibrio azureus]GAD74836.1 hypothetical protein VAZ01S_016_00200 [Vibrio azureus NBRC 104587]